MPRCIRRIPHRLSTRIREKNEAGQTLQLQLHDRPGMAPQPHRGRCTMVRTLITLPRLRTQAHIMAFLTPKSITKVTPGKRGCSLLL